MTFNNFNLRIVFYVLLILLTSIALVWSLHQEYMIATSAGLALLLIIETVALIQFIKKINRDLLRFIDAIKNQDTSLVFKKSEKDTFIQKIHNGFNEIITDFRLVRKEKELEHHFFQNTIQHVPIGLIAFNDNGRVRIQNKAIKKLLGSSKISKVSNLEVIHQDLPDLIYSLTHGEESFLKIIVNSEIKNLSIKASEVKLENEKIKIVSFQDISRDIDRSEIEAWQKLIKVLRHEIMNSISPIRIMSGNLMNLVDTKKEILNHEIAEDLTNGLKTIRNRSQGLSNFIETYKSISRIPKLNFSEINVASLLEESIALAEHQTNSSSFTINTEIVPEDLKIPGDENLLQQVLINLLKNSTESFDKTKNPMVFIKAVKKSNKTIIQIKDNGKGIAEDQLDSIFIPFYTTKTGGSGIGLSFSRQIMHLHNGSVHLNSEEGKGTTVTLQF